MSINEKNRILTTASLKEFTSATFVLEHFKSLGVSGKTTRDRGHSFIILFPAKQKRIVISELQKIYGVPYNRAEYAGEVNVKKNTTTYFFISGESLISAYDVQGKTTIEVSFEEKASPSFLKMIPLYRPGKLKFH